MKGFYGNTPELPKSALMLTYTWNRTDQAPARVGGLFSENPQVLVELTLTGFKDSSLD